MTISAPQKNVPIPRWDDARCRLTDAISEMGIGDFVAIDPWVKSKQSTVLNWAARHGWKIVTRKQDGKLGIWRIK